MTFSQKVKNEIIASEIAKGNELSMLAGIILSSGSLKITKKAISFCVSSESENVTEFVQKLIEAEESAAETSIYKIRHNFKSKERTELNIDDISGESILKKCGILSFDKNGNRQINTLGGDFLRLEYEGKLAFISGLFLGSGSITIPQGLELSNISETAKSSGYHMEWVTSKSELADIICEELTIFDVFAKKVERNDNFVVYIKTSESISVMLGVMHAHKCLLDYENLRAGREMRNLINRQANCISANIDKSINAALEQFDAIEIIKNTIGIEGLPNSLQDVALARLANKEGSLTDIMAVLPRKISKGAVSQKFKKIIEIAKELKE